MTSKFDQGLTALSTFSPAFSMGPAGGLSASFASLAARIDLLARLLGRTLLRFAAGTQGKRPGEHECEPGERGGSSLHGASFLMSKSRKTQRALLQDSDAVPVYWGGDRNSSPDESLRIKLMKVFSFRWRGSSRMRWRRRRNGSPDVRTPFGRGASISPGSRPHGVVIGDSRHGDAARNHRVDPGISQPMLGPLTRCQVEHGSIDVSDRERRLPEHFAELLDGRHLNLGDEPEMSREALEFADLCAFGLQVRLVLQRAFLEVPAEGREDHPQAGQSTCVTFFLTVEWQFGTHSTCESLPGRLRSASRVPASVPGPSVP